MIVLDVETCGLDPQKSSLLSIGAIDFLDPSRTFYGECCIWDGAEIHDSALAVNGFSREEITNKNKKPLRELIKEFLIWAERCEDKTIAGHNPHFDINFMRVSAERVGFFWSFAYRTIDLHSLCYTDYIKRQLEPPRRKGRTDINIDVVHNYVGLPDEPKPHHALTGAKMEAEAFSRLLFGKNLLSEFSHFSLPDFLEKRRL